MIDMPWALVVALVLAVGVLLLAIEVFVIPGFGAVGVLGVASMLGAVVLAYVHLGALEAVLALGLSTAVTGALLWYLPRSRAGRALVLEEVQKGRAIDEGLQALVGQRGRALTPLRPAGTVELAHRLVDVVSEGAFIDAGTPVRVSRVEGARVVVEPVPPYESEATS